MSSLSNGQREVITINVGGCGSNLGCEQLQQFAAEAGIGTLGDKERATPYDSRIGVMFDETSRKKYFARCLFVDTDPNTMHNIKLRHNYSSLIHAEYLLAGSGDCSHNFAKGHYTTGKEIIDAVNEQLRTLVESCDKLQGFLLNHAVSGGTGGGIGALILERLAVDYRRKCKFGVHLFMDEANTSAPSLEVYNTLFTLHWLLDHAEVSLLFDNKAMDGIYRNSLQNEHAKYANYNNLITKIVGDLTATTRFGINETFNTIQMDNVPFPRLHFLIASMYPLIPRAKPDAIYDDSIHALTKETYSSKHFSVKMDDFNAEEDRNMAVSFFMRGPEIEKYMLQTNEAIHSLLRNKCMHFLEWTAAKPMVKFVSGQKAAEWKSDDMLMADKQVAMMANNTCVTRLFAERVAKLFDKLYAKRCYVHHYVGEGTEGGEFNEAREDLSFLEKDYLDLMSSKSMDNDDDDDDD